MIKNDLREQRQGRNALLKFLALSHKNKKSLLPAKVIFYYPKN
jgi:hypothetical protein